MPTATIEKQLLMTGIGFCLLSKAMLEQGTSIRFQALGRSMHPFIQSNDVITLSPYGNNLPCMGDIVAYQNPCSDSLMVHRVVGMRADKYYIAGDNNHKSIDIVPLENIFGRVTQIARNKKAVKFGLGSERFLIAILTRKGLIARFLPFASKIRRYLMT